MQLTKNQIQDLYKFTKQHYVEWYDLQSELVDHLANDIEKIWQTAPNLTFEEAKRKAFKKFGVFGFMDVVEEKQKSLGKQYYKMMLNEFVRFFTIPKIVLTVSLFFSLLFFIRLINHNKYLVFILSIIVLITPFYYLIKNYIRLNKKIKEKKKVYLFEQNIANLGNIALLIQIPFQALSYIIDKPNWSLNMELFFTSTIIIFGLFIFITVKILPKKVRTIITKEYPEYAIF